MSRACNGLEGLEADAQIQLFRASLMKMGKGCWREIDLVAGISRGFCPSIPYVYFFLGRSCREEEGRVRLGLAWFACRWGHRLLLQVICATYERHLRYCGRFLGNPD